MPRPVALTAFIFIFILSLGVASTLRGTFEQSSSGQKECLVVQHALRDAAKIKVGSSRSDVEKLFVPAGGKNSRGDTFYVYPECEFIGIRIEFEVDKVISRSDFSSTDTVTKVSRLYIEYPASE